MYPVMHTIAAAMAALVIPAIACAQGAAPPACPFTPEELGSQLGQPFAPGSAMAGIVGKACTYQSKAVRLTIDAGPLQAPSAAAWRKMTSAPGTQWQAVAGDPDRAVHEIAPAGVSPYPALSYERGGWLVNITVTGVDGATAIAAWNSKLVKLRRVPK